MKIKSLVLQSFAALLILTGSVFAQSFENPWTNAKIGDWVEMKTVEQKGSWQGIRSIRYEAKKIEGKIVTLGINATLQGVVQPPTVVTIPFDPFYFYTQAGISPDICLSQPGDSSLEQGDEAISLNGKIYNCHWKRKQSLFPILGKQETVTTTAWTSLDIPLSRIVRIVVERQNPKQAILTHEVVNYGNGN